MVIEQLRVGADNYSYLVISETEQDHSLVDPSTEATQALKRIHDRNLRLTLYYYHSSSRRSHRRTPHSQETASRS